MDNSSDITLWHLFIQGDKNAFSILFKNYYPRLLNYGIKISKNADLSEECVQDFFFNLYRTRKKLSPAICIQSYLFVSFRRAILKKNKKGKKIISPCTNG